MLGLGTLLPWNFFMTATMYFTSRLKNATHLEEPTNWTAAGAEHRSVLEAKFNSVMTLCAMLPLLVFTCLNSFLLSLVPQRVRVMGSLLIIMLVFIATAALVKVQLEPLPFFIITMVKIVVINSFGAVLQGSLFGMAGSMPGSYTTPIMSGQGLAGTFAAFAMICAIASGSELHDAAFGYFITACAVISLTIFSYILLPRLEFFQFHQNKKMKQTTNEDVDKSVHLKATGWSNFHVTLHSLTHIHTDDEEADKEKPNVSVRTIFMKIWPLALSVCFTFTVTIGTFPAITADTKSTLAQGQAWDVYFIPVSCFLLFNLCDWGGRSLTAVCMWPKQDSRFLPLLILCRVAFVPLFMLCNVEPRAHLPVFFHHDAFFIAFMLLFAFSNGYLASLCMCYGPRNVLPHEAETAGAVMAFFLSLGLALGAALSFIFRSLV
uniref:Solute carrier family 29 member 1 (Augustine blood group) n=1 Tax=Cynoglossus semilaevis TaxID=244447 RepID=A0A3P8X1U6_CYNSE